MDLTKIVLRQKLIDLTRQFFVNQNFQEITTPVLVDHPPLESTLHAFQTDNFFLATSPEMSLKKLISGGLGNCFSISHSFRALESTGPHHTPEFMMLEWYQMNSNFANVIDTIQKLLIYINKGLALNEAKRTNNLLDYQNNVIDLSLPWPSFTVSSLFADYAHQDLDKLLSDSNYSESDFNQVFLNLIEPRLPTDKLVIITDYPMRFSYFATPCHPELAEGSLYAQRFELYIAGIEIANGNTEDTTTPFSIPPCAGCGLGLDRLAMVFANSTDIHDFDIG